MTKLRRFLMEFESPRSFDDTERSLTELTSFIRQNCKPFLKSKLFTSYSNGNYLFRGMNASDPAIIKTTRIKTENDAGRAPLSTSRHIHHAADSFFESKFGFGYRSSSVFCTLDEDMSINFGKPYVIIPIGDFNFCQSSVVNDFTLFFESNPRDLYLLFVSEIIENRTPLKKLLNIILDGLSKSEIAKVVKECVNSDPKEVVKALEIAYFAIRHRREMIKSFDIHLLDDTDLVELRKHYADIVENCTKFSTMRSLLHLVLEHCDYTENRYPIQPENEVMLRCKSYIAVEKGLLQRLFNSLDSFSKV